MSDIERFCDNHNACPDGRKWALENCQTPQDVWTKARADWLVWIVTRPGVLSDRELRLFAVYCAKQVEHLLTDQRSRDAIAVAERHANGEASVDELDAARAAAEDAACNAAWAAARAAADAAWDAAWTAGDAAWAAAWAAADAVRDAQAAWLRENTLPNFEVVG